MVCSISLTALRLNPMSPRQRDEPKLQNKCTVDAAHKMRLMQTNDFISGARLIRYSGM